MPARTTDRSSGIRRTPAGRRAEVRHDRPPPRRGQRGVIQLKRAYDPPSRRDGVRILVDRVWPRGMTREQIRINAWLKDLGPSTRLRQWFGHDPRRWREFRQRYIGELAGKRILLDELSSTARRRPLTLVFGARDAIHNQAVVIKEVLERKRVR
ncbi:MAG TPA: DUF488 family protein [Candidatus Dormibacteraeota bacterium]|nr:DUF488 family protein [Candidatus Dormibacteraeota bacterium]